MDPATIDGKFGPMTEQKVKIFQAAHELPNGGEVDEPTGRALDLPFWDAERARTLDPPFRDPNKFPAGHQFVFESSLAGGYFSDRPDRPFVSADVQTKRAIRANNAGALNISQWQTKMPGYVGNTQPDNAGNKTTIYLSPEDSVHAWYNLIVVRYEQAYQLISHGSGSTINIRRLAKAYGLGAPDKADDALTDNERNVVNDYLAGWRKWSVRTARPVVLEPGTEIDPLNDPQMLSLAASMFSHEASVATPLLDAQIQNGIDESRASAPGTGPEEIDSASIHQEENESSLERFQFVLRKLGGEISPENE
jgi:hypothetical protein